MQFHADTLSPQASSSAGHVYLSEADALRDSSTSILLLDKGGEPTWHDTLPDAREFERARAEIERLNARVRELAAELVQVQEAERSRFARELHDGLGAQLTASRYALARLETWLPLNAPEACQEALVTANTALDQLCETSHRLVEEGHAPAQGVGLAALLTRWIGEFGAATRLHTTFQTIADAPVLRERLTQVQNDGANTVYRIVQEALNNAAKHAAAHSVDVKLIAERRFLTLTIKDDGRGIARGARAKANRFGLSGMRARCEAVGGTFKISSQAGQGTQIRAQLPWHMLCASVQAR